MYPDLEMNQYVKTTKLSFSSNMTLPRAPFKEFYHSNTNDTGDTNEPRSINFLLISEEKVKTIAFYHQFFANLFYFSS